MCRRLRQKEQCSHVHALACTPLHRPTFCVLPELLSTFFYKTRASFAEFCQVSLACLSKPSENALTVLAFIITWVLGIQPGPQASMAGTLPSLQTPNQAFLSCWPKLLQACSVDWTERGCHGYLLFRNFQGRRCSLLRPRTFLIVDISSLT